MERYVRDVEAAGSNPVTSTIYLKNRLNIAFERFFTWFYYTTLTLKAEKLYPHNRADTAFSLCLFNFKRLPEIQLTLITPDYLINDSPILIRYKRGSTLNIEIESKKEFEKSVFAFSNSFICALTNFTKTYFFNQALVEI